MNCGGLDLKQIHGIVCFETQMAKRPQSIEQAIVSRIYGHGRGWVVTPRHFIDLGLRAAIASALKRHTDASRIRQLARGLYDYPREHSEPGTLAPDTYAVAKALAGRDAVRAAR